MHNGSIVVLASILVLRTWLEGGGEAPSWALPAPDLLAVAMVRRQSAASKTMPDAADSI
ncbi:MAG: hypothetical protein VX815_17495 [Gemmatimonadota bacterium]|nr:hypothetical protein [Gemmatimonadota bacterium]